MNATRQLKRWSLGVVVLASLVALAGPPKGGGPKGPPSDDEREAGMRKMHMLAVVGIADALGLSDAEALKLGDKLKAFEERRRPLREGMHEAMKTLKAAADGDAQALPQVDAAIAKVLDTRAQLAAIDKDLFQALGAGQPPEKRAKLALFLAKFHREAQQMRGHREGRHFGRD